MEHIDVAVIGAGVTGLASARAIAQRGFSTCVLERHPRAGHGHKHAQQRRHPRGHLLPAGYAQSAAVRRRPASVVRVLRRAQTCRIAGVASSSSRTTMSEISDIEALPARRGERRRGTGARRSARSSPLASRPSTPLPRSGRPTPGILNAEELVKALLGSAVDLGAMFLPDTRLVGAEPLADGMRLTTERETIHARVVVNAAGLYADEVSMLLGGETFTIYPARGDTPNSCPRSGIW